MLIPNNVQNTKMFQFAGAKRFAYNWALAKEQENYKNGGKFISHNDLRKEFTQLKKLSEYKWINNISNNVTKQAIKDSLKVKLNILSLNLENMMLLNFIKII